ncbi:MAG TPA: TIR domain-containing protein [Phototrophicaceae bacterium]|nr:TIR domain-containing protein [Phototrophicaceae bacterium]
MPSTPPKAKAPHVIIHKGNLTGRIYEITKMITTIGREIGNDIVVNDVAISRIHARIICVDDQAPAFILEDMGSTNGTFVNGKPLQGSIPIKFNDEILLAQDVYVIIKNGIFRTSEGIVEPLIKTERVDLRAPVNTTRPIDADGFDGMTMEDLERLSDANLNPEDDTGNNKTEIETPDQQIINRVPTSPTIDHHDVFISYSRTDLEVMRRITLTLQKAELSVWVDKQKLAPGIPSWRRAIQNAIDRSSCILVILSPDARKSQWVEAELDYAETQHKKIFCVLARGDRGTSALLGYTLSQWVDLQQDYDTAMEELLFEVKKHLVEG